MGTKVKQGVFRQDDDGHWYFIPTDQLDLFDKLLYADDDGIEFNEEFAHCQVDAPSCYKVEIIKRM